MLLCRDFRSLFFARGPFSLLTHLTVCDSFVDFECGHPTLLWCHWFNRFHRLAFFAIVGDRFYRRINITFQTRTPMGSRFVLWTGTYSAVSNLADLHGSECAWSARVYTDWSDPLSDTDGTDATRSVPPRSESVHDGWCANQYNNHSHWEFDHTFGFVESGSDRVFGTSDWGMFLLLPSSSQPNSFII